MTAKTRNPAAPRSARRRARALSLAVALLASPALAEIEETSGLPRPSAEAAEPGHPRAEAGRPARDVVVELPPQAGIDIAGIAGPVSPGRKAEVRRSPPAAPAKSVATAARKASGARAVGRPAAPGAAPSRTARARPSPSPRPPRVPEAPLVILAEVPRYEPAPRPGPWTVRGLIVEGADALGSAVTWPWRAATGALGFRDGPVLRRSPGALPDGAHRYAPPQARAGLW